MRQWEFGLSFTWLVCLPAWLLGCSLAEWLSDRRPDRIVGSLLPWRMAAVVYTATANVIVFHSPIKIGYPTTMLLFAFFAFFWTERELWHLSQRPPPRFLEWLGTWSYSIYLIHNMVLHVVRGTNLPPLAGWGGALIGVAATSYLFARLVEFPSHQAARRIARALAAPKTAVKSATAE